MSDNAGGDGEERASEQLDEDEVLWQMRTDSVVFNTDVVLPDSERGSEAERVARERLADAIRSGEADVRWTKTHRTKEELEHREELDDKMRCERCSGVTMGKGHELDRVEQGEFYEFDFDAGDQQYVLVCDNCRDEMWNKAHDQQASA